MKNRLFALLVVFVLLVPCYGHAETNVSDDDIHEYFAGYTDDQLLALLTILEYEIGSRMPEREVSVPPGKYLIGEDIPANTYTILPHSFGAVVTHYDSSGERIQWFGVGSDTPVGKIVVEDGQILEIKSGTVIFKLYEGLGF